MSLRITLLGAVAYVLLVVIVALEVPLVLNVSRRVDAEIKAESSGQAGLIATTAADELRNRAELQALVDRSGAALGGRVIVVDRAGEVVVDSVGTGLRGSSYADRPEVEQALTGQPAQGERRSESLDEELLFTAVPIIRNGRPVGAVRVTQSVAAVDEEVRNDALSLVGVGAIALAFGVGVAWVLASFLARPIGGLAAAARRVAAGDLSARAPETGPREQREVAGAFNEMATRVESVLEAQREFVANASHQMRTPLTGLRLRLEAAGDSTRDQQVSDELRAAEDEVERLSALLDNLLVLAREGQRPPEARPVDLGGAARSAHERFAGEAAMREQELELVGEGEVTVLASPDEIGIVLDNLLENALKYSAPGTTVTVGWRAGRAGVLTVDDEGPGLPPEERERAMERFYRGAGASGQPGTGLGLAIVEAIARRRSGDVWLRNREGGGLRAEVALPLAPESDLDFANP